MESRERITLFYGSNIQLREVEELSATLGKTYPEHEIEIHEGDQPYYQLIISLE